MKKYLVEITSNNKNNDLYGTFDTSTEAIVFISQNSNSLDGYRVIAYEQPNRTLRSGSKIELQCQLEDETTNNIYDTKEEADVVVSNLADSDGYKMIDLEQPVGSAASYEIEVRPSLWTKYHETYFASRVNQRNREDADRY